ncbi:telomere-protecting terminal protein Tpg [Streptomyces sp. NPDC001812]|uniref:telomere-protecting terminal protein Tpg n=1 Tax=Streptomyces sp. NPDC001812 TaxID=3364611 RepID=UPI003674376F
MGIVGDGLRCAVQGAFTRPVPKSAGVQMSRPVRQLKGTRAVADALGVSQRTVEGYAKDQIRRPRADLAQRLEDAVRARRQPRIRAQARRQAATSTDLVVDTRARFGFTAALGTTDDAHIRHLTLTLALPPQHAARPLAAQGAGATEQQLRDIAAEGLGEIYFRDGGRRAHGLEVEFTELFPTWLVSGRVGVGAG